ncbi:caspase family protein [Synechocystis sp. PCC 7339]|uniref:caspase family protein n=1 Tax=Synechocystis sp. PCC 7339 TaxID=2782213 RepID=UPI001CBD5C90|nr:caspase family protein [Synechocystis sp. PCC 7339]UAJ71732.1 caspase family protein [Synechocystis sp. PCC 7339]
MTFDRRTFLRSGIALGLGSWAWGWSARTMGQSLASTTNQKWALLLAAGQGDGTNGDRRALMGCRTDRQLLGGVLTGRYGFDQAKVAGLDPQAMTLPALETLFDNHLRQQVQKGDPVVVAFSGYGSYNPPAAMTPSPTWEQALPYLGLFLAGEEENNLLPLTTLVNWLQSLKTKQIYLVLDCGFSIGGKEFEGNLRGRSGGRGGQMPPEVNASNPPAKASLGNITLISATGPGQTAVEVQLGKQSAGLFTLALTQSLWENNSASAMASLWEHSRNLLVPRLGAEQIPQWRSPNNSPDFLVPTTLAMGGEGMVTGLVSENSLQSQIVALAPLVQKRALVHSCYLTVPAMGAGSALNNANALWQVQSVKGQSATLTAIAAPAPTKAESAAPTPTAANDEKAEKETLVGSGLREIYRAIPRTLALTVALAHDLERIERVDATSAFGAISAVEAVINAGDSSADCVFGKLEVHRYSLFTEGGNPLQPLTKSESSGAVKTVISALDPCLNRLLALKWLTLLANGDSTQLGAALKLVQQTSGDNPLPRLTYQWRSTRYPHPPQDNSTGNGANGVPNAPPSFLPTVATNQALQCELENFGEEPLYGCLIGVNNRGLSVAAILHPDLKLLQGKEQLTWPSPEDPLWIIGGDKAIAHWFLILSRFPLPATVTALGQQITGNNSTNPPSLENNPPRVLALKNLLPVVLALVQDLTAHGVTVAPVPDDMVLLSTADWLSLPIMYQVI